MIGVNWRLLTVGGLSALTMPAISHASDSFPGASEYPVSSAPAIVSLDSGLTTEASAATRPSRKASSTESRADSSNDEVERVVWWDNAVASATSTGSQVSEAPPASNTLSSSADGESSQRQFFNVAAPRTNTRFASWPWRSDCPSPCQSGCNCNGGCDGSSLFGTLLGGRWIKPSELCFDDFISPVSNPFYFEDPRTLSEVRFIFMNEEFRPSLGGQSGQLFTMQARVALSQRFSLIVTKFGYFYSHPNDGFPNVNTGFKYNLYRDPKAGRIYSAGMTYEVPLGTTQIAQGIGDGEFNFFWSGGTRILGSRNAHWVSTSGLRQPLDESLSSRITYSSNHFDYRLPTRLPTYVFTEINWWHYLTDGQGGAPAGGDLFNLGAPARGANLVTQAFGGRIKLRQNVITGAALEFPLGGHKGAMTNRVTMDLIVRY